MLKMAFNCVLASLRTSTYGKSTPRFFARCGLVVAHFEHSARSLVQRNECRNGREKRDRLDRVPSARVPHFSPVPLVPPIPTFSVHTSALVSAHANKERSNLSRIPSPCTRPVLRLTHDASPFTFHFFSGF
jgi:hypothetical protein